MLAEQQRIGEYEEIIQQLGGNKFLVMTGSKIKYYGYDKNGYVYLMIELIKNKSGAKYLKVQYNSNDLYDLEFSKVKRTANKKYLSIGIKIYDEESAIVKTFNDAYAEDLQNIFTSVTGLYTKLF